MDNQKTIKWLIGVISAVAVLSIIAVVGLIYSQPNVNITAPFGGTTNYDDLEVDNITVSETTTLQEIAHGSRLTSALTFTAGSATGTPGSIFSIENTTGDMLCTSVVLDIDTAPLDSMVFAVSTSTAGTSCSAGVCGGVIASSTVATATIAVLNSDVTGMKAFKWNEDEFIIGGLASSFRSASSSAYTSVTGEVYLNCFNE